MMVRKYKAFLTSSEELAQERKEIAVMISRQNNQWTKQDIYVEPVIWEELLNNFKGKKEKIADYFKKEMLNCDFVIALLYKKTGLFTEETFKQAYENSKKGKKPRHLFIYFKSGSVAIEDIDEELLKISSLKKEIQKHQQLYGTFGSMEELEVKLLQQIDRVIIHDQKVSILDKEAANKEKEKIELGRHRQYLEQRFRYLDFTGLNAILQKPLPLENIYIRLRGRKSLPARRFQGVTDFARLANGIIGADENEDEDISILFEGLYRQKQLGLTPLRLLILGQPGSGKTTLMKWISLQCLKEENNFFYQFVPVYISLRELGNDPDHTYRAKSLFTLAMELMTRENVSVEAFFDSNFKANRILFLLDGLDEIGDENKRREVVEWIENQYIAMNTIITTSRFSGLNEAENVKFSEETPVLTIRDFKIEDVELFLRNWYSNIETAAAGERSTREAIEEGEKKYRDLIGIIKDDHYKSLRELAVNPLLLTIIAIVHRTRAVLPRERYKLYEECLKVMIELWNLSNRKIDVGFSFENSMIYLAKIAVHLMESEKREMTRGEILTYCLPARIEGHRADFFLKEMVLKAGLLYESEGKCGFLHPTFQEYLAARYFAASKKQLAILFYWDRGYWAETFRLFVNVGSAENFFDEVIHHLLKKGYLMRMKLWEECLESITAAETRQKIELKFAEKIVNILLGLEYNEKNEKLIEVLFLHYPLYKHGERLVKNGWRLLNEAAHPFVRSVGVSILNRADEHTGIELMKTLQERMDTLEEQPDAGDEESFHFLLSHNTSLIIHFAGGGSLAAFHYGLTKLKSANVLLQYLALLALRDIVAITSILDFQDLRAMRGILGFLDLRNFRDIRGLVDLRKLRDPRDFQNLTDLLDRENLKKLRKLRDLLVLFDLRKLRNFLGLLELQEQQHHYIKNIFKNYSQNKDKLRECRRDIAAWSEQALEKLHGMPDSELLAYFPNTTEDELKQFHDIYINRIAAELSRGNPEILKGKILTGGKKKKIVKQVTFDFKTVERMLNFDLGALYEEEKHGHYLKAFEILRNKDYGFLRELIGRFMSGCPDNRLRANALYILKNLL